MSAHAILSTLQVSAGLQVGEHSSDRLQDSHRDVLHHHDDSRHHLEQHGLPLLLPGHLQHVLQAVPGTPHVLPTHLHPAVRGHDGQVRVRVEGDDLLPDSPVCTPQP